VEVSERIWQTDFSSYARLLGVTIGVEPRSRSKRLNRVLTDFGCEHSFAQAAARVNEHYGFVISVSAVRSATLQAAQKAKERMDAEYAEPFRVIPAEGAAFVVAQADGSMLCTVPEGLARNAKRPREWKEVRLAAAQSLGSSQTFYAATFGQVDLVGQRWGHCAKRAGWGLNTQIHAVGDGAEWIRLQTREVFGPEATFLCDYYHVSEYLAEAAEICCPNGPSRWRKTQQKRLRRGAVQKVLNALAEHKEPEGTPEEDAPVNNAHRYLNNRLDCIDYARAIAHGLPIGSGMIESGHRHVLQARMKKAGAAWLPSTAEIMANLRVLRANNQWASLWN
jgi:hypothetical protein